MSIENIIKKTIDSIITRMALVALVLKLYTTVDKKRIEITIHLWPLKG